VGLRGPRSVSVLKSFAVLPTRTCDTWHSPIAHQGGCDCPELAAHKYRQIGEARIVFRQRAGKYAPRPGHDGCGGDDPWLRDEHRHPSGWARHLHGDRAVRPDPGRVGDGAVNRTHRGKCLLRAARQAVPSHRYPNTPWHDDACLYRLLSDFPVPTSRRSRVDEGRQHAAARYNR
jgi:hypothetical protein